MRPRVIPPWIGLLTAVGASWTCADTTAPIGAARIEVVPPVVRTPVGQSVQLTATARDGGGLTLSGVSFRYESEDSAVATVSSTGRVTGAGAGTTTVIVGGGGASARVPVQVGGVPSAIEVTPATPEVVQGTSVALIVVVRDANGDVVPDAAVTFTTNDPAVAIVTPTGIVTGIGGGPATITVTAVPATRAVSVTVLGRPSGTDVVSTRLPDRTYGIAVSVTGVVYATRPDASALARALLPATAFPVTIAVGAIPTDVAFDPSGARAYVTNQISGSVSIVDVASNAQTDVIPVPGGPLRVLVSPSGSRLYVTTGAGSLLVFDLPSKNPHAEYALGAASNGITFHPNGVLLYGTTYDGLVFEVNTATDSARALSTTGTLQDIVVSRDGALLYIAKQDGDLEVRSAPTGALLTTIPAAAGAFGLKLTPDGTQLYATIPAGGVLRIIDRTTRALVRTIGMTDPRRIAFDRYGRTAVVADQAGDVFFIR